MRRYRRTHIPGSESQDDRGAYKPTQEEIKRVAAEIRAGWSRRARRQRLGIEGDPTPLTAPIVAEPSLDSVDVGEFEE